MTKACCSERSDSIVRINDPASSTIKLRNPAREKWLVCDIDGCVIKDHRKRCDKLVTDNDTFTVLIELKGGDIEGAFKQLDQTFNYSELRTIITGKRCGLVVSKSVRMPNFDEFYRKSKEHFAKTHKSRFLIERHDREICPKDACGV